MKLNPLVGDSVGHVIALHVGMGGEASLYMGIGGMTFDPSEGDRPGAFGYESLLKVMP